MLLLSILNDNGNGNMNDLMQPKNKMLLQKFLSDHWQNNQTDSQDKKSIKFNTLNESLFADKNYKLLKATSMIISALAELDYPEKYNNLFDIILAYIQESLNNKNVLLLSGSIDILEYFIVHICDIQIPTIVPILFPLLYTIITLPLSIDIKYKTLNIYSILLNVTLEMKNGNNESSQKINNMKNSINSTIINYLKHFNDNIFELNENNIKLQILSIKIINDITKLYSISIVNCLPWLLKKVWKLMLNYCQQIHNKKVKLELYKFYDISFEWLFTILKHKRREIGLIQIVSYILHQW